MAITTTPHTTPPAMAPTGVDDDDDDEGFAFGAEPCPLVLFVAGDVDAEVDLIVSLGTIFLNIGPRAPSLNPPCGETNVAPQMELKAGQ